MGDSKNKRATQVHTEVPMEPRFRGGSKPGETEWTPKEAADDDPLVYAWAIWRDPTTGLYRRARMHLPVDVVIEYAVGGPSDPDLVSRVVPQIERDLVSETLNRGIRWQP